MEILKEILSRRSIRRYKSNPVEDEKIRIMLESASLAPSGNNSQPWNFIVVHSKEKREHIVEACNKQKWMLQAPVFLVCVADIRAKINKSDHVVISEESPQIELKQVIRDTAIAGEHLVLQAESLGLTTCWVAFFDQKDIRPVLNVPSDKYIVAVITVGYADESPHPRPRKPLDDIIHFEIWGQKGTSSDPSFFS
jgi:nitroreductase